MAKKTAAQVQPSVRGAKIARAVEIVQQAFTERQQLIATGKSIEGLESPRAIAISKIASELFPGEGQKAACNTYYAMAFERVLTAGNENALAVAAKGKAVYSVFNLHRSKKPELSGTVSSFGLVTSQQAAKDLQRLLGMDGFIKGQVVKNKAPTAA